MTGPADGSASRPSTVAATAAHHARTRPDQVAVECAGRRLTYLELHRESNRTAHALHAEGAATGTRVAHLAGDTEHFYDLLLGCAKSGAVLVPVDPRLTSGEAEHVLRDSETEILFTDAERLPLAETLAARLHSLRTVVVLDDGTTGRRDLAAWKSGHPGTDPEAAPGLRQPLAQIYTSGTTGAPKGVVLSQGAFWAVHRLLERHRLDWIDWREDDRILHVLPCHHIGGPWWFLQGFRAGACSVLAQGFDAGRTLRLLNSHGITTTLLVPSMLQVLLGEPDAGPEHFTGLRKVVYGGSPMPEALLKQCLETMGCEFAQIYGLTETCASAVCLPPEDHVPGSPRLSAAGRPYPGVAVQIVGPDGEPLPPGRIGEIHIDTPAVMDEYWRRPEETARTLRDGWLRTGDAGYLDDDGYVHLRDRIKDVILVAGENVYPAEVESALSRHPEIAEAAVVGVPDTVRGEAVHACVVARPGAAPAPRELARFLRERLADYKIPTAYTLLDSLPRNPGGKVLRRELRDRL